MLETGKTWLAAWEKVVQFENSDSKTGINESNFCLIWSQSDQIMPLSRSPFKDSDCSSHMKTSQD